MSLFVFGIGAGLLMSQLGNVIMSAALIGSVLLLGLLNGFNTSVEENPALSPNVKEQISAATETGIPIITTEDAYQVLRDAGLQPADAAAVTDDYADAQLDALKMSMLAVALLALLSFWFTRRLPGRPAQTAR